MIRTGQKCSICGVVLNQDADGGTLDCGGDCLRCMAEAGDPDCVAEMRLIEPDEIKWQSELDDQ